MTASQTQYPEISHIFFLSCTLYTHPLLYNQTMPSLPNASTVVSWFFYLIPIYIFVLAPLLSQIFPRDEEDTWGLDYAVAYDAEGNEIPALNLEDDSFISPEDDVPLNCPRREAGEDFKVHILSRDPLVIYIENFLTEKEADHLVDVR